MHHIDKSMINCIRTNPPNLLRVFCLVGLIYGFPNSLNADTKVIKSKVNSLAGQNIQLPSFFVWKGPFEYLGNARLQPYRVKSDGQLIAAPKLGKVLEFTWDSAPKWLKTYSTDYSEIKNHLETTFTSKNGQWNIRLTVGDGEKHLTMDGKLFLEVQNNQTESTSKTFVPTNGWSPQALFWHRTKPLFYFTVTTGPSDSRTQLLYEFDCSTNQVVEIGYTGGRMFQSPDGEWIIWDGGMMLRGGGSRGGILAEEYICLQYK